MSFISLYIKESLDNQFIENFRYSLSSNSNEMPHEWQVSFYQEIHIPMYGPGWHNMSSM